jgi:acetyl esterase/lipase
VENPLTSPLFANLKGLPATTIINADLDPLRDDGAAYAEKLKAAGVSVTRKIYLGVTHEFFAITNVVAKARERCGRSQGEFRHERTTARRERQRSRHFFCLVRTHPRRGLLHRHFAHLEDLKNGE